MELSTVQQILLIILASALAIFLILAIAIAVIVIRLLQKLRLVADKAEKIVDTAASMGNVFKRSVESVNVFRFVQNVVNMAQQKRKDKE